MGRRSILIVTLIGATIPLIGLENRKKPVKADVSPTSVLTISAPPETDPVQPKDTAAVLINVLDFVSSLSAKQTSYPTSNDSVPETLSVLDFISSLEEIDSTALILGSRPATNRLYSGKLPVIDKRAFRRPVSGKITSTFGPNPERTAVHYGVDLKSKAGDTVIVALPGVVKSCKNDPKGYGLYVCVVDSSGVETRYAHLSKILVKRGEKLGVGTPIGLVGSTGNSTGPHLHFEMRYKGKLLDPTLFME